MINKMIGVTPKITMINTLTHFMSECNIEIGGLHHTMMKSGCQTSNKLKQAGVSLLRLNTYYEILGQNSQIFSRSHKEKLLQHSP